MEKFFVRNGWYLLWKTEIEENAMVTPVECDRNASLEVAQAAARTGFDENQLKKAKLYKVEVEWKEFAIVAAVTK